MKLRHIIEALAAAVALSCALPTFAQDVQPPSSFGFQTNPAAAATDTVPPAEHCHITNLIGAADDGPPDCYAHLTNRGTATDDTPPDTFMHLTNPNATPDGTLPSTYIHVTNWLAGLVSGDGLIPQTSASDCLLATTVACLAVKP